MHTEVAKSSFPKLTPSERIKWTMFYIVVGWTFLGPTILGQIGVEHNVIWWIISDVVAILAYSAMWLIYWFPY